MTDTEHIIVLDRKTRALRSANRWAVQRLQPSGDWDLVNHWNGGRRSLLAWCEANDVHPDRAAEAALAMLPESDGFRERS
jgi:hypothetical protein